MQIDAIEIGDLRHSGPTGEFVTKPDQVPFGGQHSGAKAFVQRRPGLGTHFLQQGDVGARTAHRNRMHRFARLGRQPPKSAMYRLGDAARQAFPGQRVRPGGQHLGDEKRVTAGDMM